MFGVLVAAGALAALGVLFSVDPGGAIAESGFPDGLGRDPGRLAAWGFRTAGVVAAQLLVIALWIWPKHRPPRASEGRGRPWYSGTPPAGSLPAAAVSALVGHAVWSPTRLASLIEMCQRGTLRIEAVATRVGFLYRLSRQGPPEHDWERTILGSLPARPVPIDELDEALGELDDAIGDQIGDYLHSRRLFHGNPIRTRRENRGDAVDWNLLAGVLMGVGTGLWAALWLDAWWASALLGAFTGLVYFLMAAEVPTGMLAPTEAGELEIGRWLALKESLAESPPTGARDHSEPMLAYAVALGVAGPWLAAAAPAPPWFGAGGAAPLSRADRDAAYRAFIHSQWWNLPGRSDEAAKAAAGAAYELELELLGAEPPGIGPAADREAADESEETGRLAGAPDGLPAAPARARSTGWEGPAEEAGGGGCLRGCLTWMAGAAGAGVLVLVVLLALDVVSPREKPCPLDSPPIPTPAQIAVAGDLFRDQCVAVRGTLASRDAGELLLEVERGEYVQRVVVRDLAAVLDAIALGRVVTLGGWLRVEEDGTYAVDFIPDRGSDRGWWQNLRDNLEALF